MDIITRIYQWIVEIVSSWPNEVFLFFPRIFLCLGLPIAFAVPAFLFKYRTKTLQWFVCLLGFLIACELPIESISYNDTVKGWIFLFSLLACATFPQVLSFFLTRKNFNFWKNTLIIDGIIAFLLILNLF